MIEPMQLLGSITVWAGLILLLLGGLLFIVVAFKESILWGLGVLFLPIASLIFLIFHWDTAKRPFFWQLGGMLLVMIGAMAFHARIPILGAHY